MDKERLAHSKDQVERDLSAAGDKRREKQEQMREKLRKHINKVEEVRKEQAIKRKESSESLKQMIEQKLDNAENKRDEYLEQIKTVAHHSGEKKKHNYGDSYLPGENIPLKAPGGSDQNEQ